MRRSHREGLNQHSQSQSVGGPLLFQVQFAHILHSTSSPQALTTYETERKRKEMFLRQKQERYELEAKRELENYYRKKAEADKDLTAVIEGKKVRSSSISDLSVLDSLLLSLFPLS